MARSAPVQKILDTLTGYQRSAALAAAIELDLFTAIADGVDTIEGLSARCNASPRGLASLAHYLVADGFLTKSQERFGLAEATAPYLDRNGAHALTDVSKFLTSAHLRSAFENLTDVVRSGGTRLPAGGLMSAEHPAWQAFARGMSGVAAVQALEIAERAAELTEPGPILDIAAGHGQYGIALANHWPDVPLTFQDWPDVVSIAVQHAEGVGLADRVSTLPGDAFELSLGGPYAAVMVPNLLHHFPLSRGVELMAKVYQSLAEDGVAVIVESLVHDDRVSPPAPAMFSLVMLATTEAGDVFTEENVDSILRDAGFSGWTTHALEQSPQSVTLARK